MRSLALRVGIIWTHLLCDLLEGRQRDAWLDVLDDQEEELSICFVIPGRHDGG